MASITNSAKNSETSHDSFSDYFFSKIGRRHLLIELGCASLVFSFVIVLAKAQSWTTFRVFDLINHVLYMLWVVFAFVSIVHIYQRELNRKSQRQVLIYVFVLLQLIVLLTSSLLHIAYCLGGDGWQNFGLRGIKFISLHLSYSILLGGFCLHYIYVKNQWLHKKNSELKYRVQAMQARIHPHFLFNSLNSAVSLIAIDPDKAEEMLINLSRLFRASFQELKLVSLKEEITLCQHYLSIEKIRLGERLNVEWKICANERLLNQIQIPLLTLQPLLENSILHGIEKISSTGTISILVEVVDCYVSVVIHNPYQTQESTVRREHNGIAVENVKQRLAVYYGHSLKFHHHQGDGLYTTLFSYQYTEH